MKKFYQIILIMLMLVTFSSQTFATVTGTVTTTSTSYCVLSVPQTINVPVSVFVATPNAEYIDYVSITAPAGITITHVTPLAGVPACGSGSATAAWFGAATQTVSWAISLASLTTPTGCGYWSPGTAGQNEVYTVQITIPANYNSPITLNASVGGDGWQCASACNCGTRSCINTPLTLNASMPLVGASSLPTPAIVCQGSSLTLNGTGASTYTWTDGVNTPTDGLAFVPTSSSTYTVTGTDGSGCTATSTIAVTVNASPVVSSTATPSAICLGGSSTLDAISPSLVVFTENFANNSQGWTLGTEWGIGSATAGAIPSYGNADPATDNTPTADNGVAGVVIGGNATTTLHPAYYLTSPVINLAGLSNVNLNFARWLNSDYTPFMQNTIDVFDGSTWVNIWQTGGSPGIQDNAWTPQTFNISAYVNANFQVRFGVSVGSAGAFSVSSWNIDDVEITSSPTMTWSGPATIANPALASTLVTPGTSGAQTYTVTVTDGNGCTATSTSVVTVNAPSVTANSLPSPATVCAGNTVTLNGAGATTYTWTDGINTPTDGVAFTPTANSTYTVTGTDGIGCTATSTIAVNVNASPVVSSTATPSAICLGGSSTLDAISPSLVVFTENFANNSQGWTLGTEWGIGSATAGAIPSYGNADPATDNTPTADNGVAGVVIGGNATTTLHPAYYLTSPVINLAGLSNVNLNFARWLNSDYTPFMQNTIDVFDGSTWVNIWQTGGSPGIQDNAWTPQTFNISAYVNANFQVRFGVSVGSAGAFSVSSWNIDDVEITSSPTMTWSGPATIANPALASTLVTPGTSGAQTYTVTVTDGNGCTATSTSVVTVNAPSVTANSLPSPATVCAGSTVTLNGAGATTYTWTDGVNTPTDGLAFVPTSNSTYTVTGTDGSGCTATSTIAVTVNSLPTVGATSLPTPAIVCQGSSLTLSGTGASTYTWTDGSNTPTDGVAFVPASSSTYTVTGTDGNGCIGTSTLAVTVNAFNLGSSAPVPEVLYYKFDGTGTSVPNLASAPPIGTATATILGGISQGGVGQSGGALVGSGITATTDYLNTGYMPNLGTGSWTISFWSEGISTNATLYYIFGETATASFRCFTNGVAGSGNWILRGAGLTDVYINGGAQLTPTLNTFVYDATLNNVKGYLNGVLVSTVAQGTPNLTGTGQLKVMGYGSNIGAPVGGKLDEFRIYNHALTPAEVLSLLTINPSFSATATPNMVCPGSTVSLESTGGSGIVSYSWAPGSLSGNPVNATVASSTVYTVTATDNNGCTGTTTTTVNTYPAVNVSATSTPTPATVCQGSNVTLNGAGALSYTWTDGTNTPTDGVAFAPASSSTYTVTGTDGNGCTGTSSLAVTVNPAPSVTASATPSTTCNNSTVTPMGGGASTYVWSGGLTDNTPFVATTGTTTYTVTGTDGIGCTATSTVSVTVNAASGMLASATSNQAQNQADDFNLSYYDPSCNLIATVDDGAGGNILGLTTATVNVDANAGVHNGQPFVRRWYQITPSNNVGVSASVTLYIDQADFTNYNNAVASPYLPMPTSGNNSDPNITNIRITKNSDAGLGNTPEVITPTTVNWNGNYWELTFPVTGFSQFRVHSANPGNTPLPATITKFNGRKLNSSDMLEWTTASEQNNAYFNLQHSTNGVDFKTIAMVNSKAQNGNSQTELNYNYEHTTPSLGHNYYRLEQVDIDNQSTINAKIVDLIWGANGNTVSMYPNPTQDVLNIDLYTSKVQNTTVKVLDMSGRVVKQIQARSEAGMSTLSISLSELASGVYTVQVYDNDKLSHVGKVKKN